MIWYFVAAFGWVCPGGLFSPIVPGPLKPLICSPAMTTFERFDPAQRSRAEGRIRELGAAAKLYRCDARRCREVTVQWRTEATFKGE